MRFANGSIAIITQPAHLGQQEISLFLKKTTLLSLAVIHGISSSGATAYDVLPCDAPPEIAAKPMLSDTAIRGSKIKR